MRDIEFATARFAAFRSAIEKFPDEADAILFAFDTHGNQKYGALPYITHLHDVRTVLADCTTFTGHIASEPIRLAAWLHDTVEDSTGDEKDYVRQTINDNYGVKVERLVLAVSGYGRNRRERFASTLASLRAYPEAVSLKLADRIANVEACVRDKDPRLEMYRKEQPAFDGLRLIGDDIARALWPRLDAAFAKSQRANRQEGLTGA